ncbi:MAG: metal-dependent transcriptional regulator [Candidatus Aureabacteria bacterium]|nr:metal-dependent transcriptional regulator [Candidatus Auribacterota bacterium]
MKKRKLSSSMEDYLETIAVLKKEKGVARVRDISLSMNVKTSSVTSALNVLSKNGFVIHERYGYVDLTPEGESIARGVQRRHNILIKFLSKVLKIDSRIAAEDACKMEHSISPQSLKKLTKFIEFVETCPDTDRPDWLKSFDYYFKTGKRRGCKMRDVKKNN